jgi:hypothetical protein
MNRIVGLLLSAVFGLFFLAAGVAGVALEYRTPPVHTTHLFAFLFLVLLGASLFPWVGPLVFARIKDSAGLAGQYLPTFGRRASQGEVVAAPPASPVVPPAQPDAMPGEGGPS